MKSFKSWLCVLSAVVGSTPLCTVWGDVGLDAYREGRYAEAAPALKSAQTKDAVAYYYLGRMRLYGYGDLKNNQLALQDFQQAAERGYLPAQQIMARYALLVQKNPEDAVKWFKKAADTHNDISAQMFCAAAYLYGFGVKKNEDIAKKYYIAAAKNGQSTAQYAVAKSFLEGGRHSLNKQLGMIWLNKSVAQKNPAAYCLLGKIENSTEWTEKAVALNYEPAIIQMGQLAQKNGDFESAKLWYSKMAEKHDADAEFALANLYLQPKTALYDLHNGLLWMQRAAQDGNTEAATALSKMYQEGKGVEVNDALAKQWAEAAKKHTLLKPVSTETKMAEWITNGSIKNLADCGYRLPGIFSVWRNPKALQENHENPAPQMVAFSKDTLFKPQLTLLNPNQIPLSEIYTSLIFQKASKNNSVDGILNRSSTPLHMPHYEVGSVADIDQLKQKALLGVTPAMFELGLCYQYGQCGLQESKEDAIKWFTLAKTQNDLRAVYQLGLIYLNNFEHDNSEHYHSEDTNTENNNSQNIKVASKKQSHHVKNDDWKTGVGYLNDAAFKGNPYAAYVLGQIHEKDGNIEQASAYYQIAAVNQLGLASYRLAELMAHEKQTVMTREERLKNDKLLQRLYSEAAKDHVSAAQLPLAFYHATGTPDEQKEAFNYALQEAPHNPDAALLLGLLYDRGIGVQASHKDAMTWYQAASPSAVRDFILGTDEGLQGNNAQARVLLAQAAQHDLSFADYNLAILKAQLKEPFLDDLNKALALGDSRAGELLADYIMSQPNSDEAQMSQARKIYQSFAEKGDAQSQLKLAYMQEQGLGGKMDRVDAAKWYQLAAEQGNARAQYLLGHLYQMGWIDNTPNYTMAEKWYSAAEAKYPPAAIALGFIEETVNDNYAKAHQHYSLAAQANEPTAAYDVGLIYQAGKDRPVDLKQAEQWLQKAISMGYTKAQVALRNMLQTYSAK